MVMEKDFNEHIDEMLAGIEFISDEQLRKDTSNLKKSIAKKGKLFTKEHVKNLSNAFVGRKLSQTTRKKISKAGVGRKVSTESREKMSSSAKKRPPINEKTRLKKVEAGKRKRLSYISRDEQIISDYNILVKNNNGNNYGVLKKLSKKYKIKKSRLSAIIKKYSK